MAVTAQSRFISPSSIGHTLGGSAHYALERELRRAGLLPPEQENINIRIGNEVHDFVDKMIKDPDKRNLLPEVFRGYTESEKEFGGLNISAGTVNYQTGGTIDLMDFGSGSIADIKTGYGRGAQYQLETYALLAEANNKFINLISVIKPDDVSRFKRVWQQAETDDDRLKALGMMRRVVFEWNDARRQEARENIVRAYNQEAQIKAMVEKVPQGAKLVLPDPSEDYGAYRNALRASLQSGSIPITMPGTSEETMVNLPTVKEAKEIDELGFDPNESFYVGEKASKAGAKVVHKYTKYGHTPSQVLEIAGSIIGDRDFVDVTAGEIDRRLNNKFQDLYGEVPSQVPVSTSRYMQPAQRQRLLTGIIDEKIKDISDYPEGTFRRHGSKTLISAEALLRESVSVRNREGVPLTPHDPSTPKGKVKIAKDIQRHGAYQYADVIVGGENILRRAGSPQGPLDKGGIKVSEESPGVLKGINLDTLVLMENWLPQGQQYIQKGLVDRVSQVVTKEVELPANFELNEDSIKMKHVWGEGENVVPFEGSAPIDIDALGTKGEDGKGRRAMPVDAGTRSAWTRVKLIGYDIVQGEWGRKKLSMTFERMRGIADNIAFKTFFEKHTLAEADLSQMVPTSEGLESLTYLKRPDLFPASYWFAQDESTWKRALGSKFTGDKELTWENYSADLTDYFLENVLPGAMTVETLRFKEVHEDQLRFLKEKGGDRVTATQLESGLFDVTIENALGIKPGKLFRATRLENIVRKPRLGAGDLAKLRDRSPEVYKNLMERTKYGREWRQGLMKTAIASYGIGVPGEEGYTELTYDLAQRIVTGTADFGIREENMDRTEFSRAIMLSAKKVLEEEGIDPTKPLRVGSKYLAAPEYAPLLGAADVEGYDVTRHGRAYASVFESIINGQTGEYAASKYAEALVQTVGGKDFRKKAFSAIDPKNMYGNVGQASRRLAANEIVLPENFVLRKYLGDKPRGGKAAAEYEKNKEQFLESWKKGNLTVPALAWGQPTTGRGEEFGSYIKVLHPDTLKGEELPAFSSRFVLSEQLAEAMGRDFDADLFWSMLIGKYESGKINAPKGISLAESKDILKRARESEAAGRASLLAGGFTNAPVGMEEEWNKLVKKYKEGPLGFRVDRLVEKPNLMGGYGEGSTPPHEFLETIKKHKEGDKESYRRDIGVKMFNMLMAGLQPLTPEQTTEAGRYAEDVLKGKRLGISYNFIDRMQKLIRVKFGNDRELQDAAGHFFQIVHGRRQGPKRLDEELATAMQILGTISPTSGGYIKTPEAYLKAMQGPDPESEIWAKTWKGMASYPVVVKNLLSSDVPLDVREGMADEEGYEKTIARLAFPGRDNEKTMQFIKEFRAADQEKRRELWVSRGLKLLRPDARDPVSGYTSTPLGLTFALGLHERGRSKGWGVQYSGIEELLKAVNAQKFGAYADIPAFVRQDEARLLRTLERVLPGNVDKLTNIVSGMESKGISRQTSIGGVQFFGTPSEDIEDLVAEMATDLGAGVPSHDPGEPPEFDPELPTTPTSQPGSGAPASPAPQPGVPYNLFADLMFGSMQQWSQSAPPVQNIWPMSKSDLEEAITILGREKPGEGLTSYRNWVGQRVASDVPFSPREIKRINEMQTAVERMNRAAEGWGVRGNVSERAKAYLQDMNIDVTDEGKVDWEARFKQHETALGRSLAQEQQSQIGLMRQEVETRQELLDAMDPFIPKWKELNKVASESRKGIGALKDIDQSLFAKMTKELGGLGAEQWEQAGITPGELAKAQGAVLQGQLQEIKRAGSLTGAIGGVFNKLTSGWELMRMSRMWNMTGGQAIGNIQTAAQQQATSYQAASLLTPFGEMEAPTGVVGDMMRLQARTSRFRGLMGETAYNAYGGLMGTTQTPQMAEAMGVALPAVGAGYLAGNLVNIAAPLVSALTGVTLGPLAAPIAGAAVTGIGAAWGFGNRVDALVSNEEKLALSSYYGTETTASGEIEFSGDLTLGERVALREVAEQRLADRGITPTSVGEDALMAAKAKSPGGIFRPEGAIGQQAYEGLVEEEIKDVIGRGMELASKPMSQLTPSQKLEAVRAAASEYTQKGGPLEMYESPEVEKQFSQAMLAFPEMATIPEETMKSEWFKNVMLSGGVEPIMKAGKAWGLLPSQSAQTIQMMDKYGWGPTAMMAAGEQWQRYKQYAGMWPGLSKEAFMFSTGRGPRVGATWSGADDDAARKAWGAYGMTPGEKLSAPDIVEALSMEGMSPEPFYAIAKTFGKDKEWGTGLAERVKEHLERSGLGVGDDEFKSLTSKLGTWSQRLVPFGLNAGQIQSGVLNVGVPNISNQAWQSFTGSIGQWMPNIPAGGVNANWMSGAVNSIQKMVNLSQTPGSTFLDKEWGQPGVIDTSWDYQREMRDEQMRYTRAQTGFQVAKINARRVYLWGADQGGTWDQPATGSLWSLQDELTEMQREYQFENQSNALERQKAMAGLSYRQTLERLGLSREKFAVQQGYADIGFARQEEELARQFSRSRVQYGWKTEDLERKQMISGREFGWRMEDIEEALKYATGRQRRQLLVRQERETIRYGDQAQQFDTQEDRLQQLQDWRREDFAEREESLRIQMAKHRELSALQEDSFNMQERHARERYDLIMSFTEEDEERLEQLKEIHKKQDEIKEKQREYQAQQLNMQEQQAGAALAHAEALAKIRLEWQESQAAMTASSSVLDQLITVLQFIDQILTEGENNTMLQGLLDILTGGAAYGGSLPYDRYDAKFHQ